MDAEFAALAEHLGKLLLAKQWRIVTAESCTGGWIAQVITTIAGSSQWFDRGYVTYSNEAKLSCLGVNAQALQEHGAVSEVVVKQMAQGALTASSADVALAVTGIAGPAGGDVAKPVGTVWFAWAIKNQSMRVHCHQFSGDRQAIRAQSVKFAMQELISMLA